MIYSYSYTSEDIRKCDDFAKKMGESKKRWHSQHPVSVNQMHASVIIGKVGEIGAASYLKSFGIDTSPDFNIYTRHNKSFDADLRINRSIGAHVKTQDVKLRRIDNDASWVFMKADPITYVASKDVVIFTSYDSTRKTVNIISCLSGNCLQMNNLFKPTLRQDNSIKCAIYWRDIKNIPSVRFVHELRN